MENPKKLFTSFLFLAVFACSSSKSLLEKKLNQDIDGDGIANFVDKDSTVYGPVVDKDGNHVVSMGDTVINEKSNIYREMINSRLKYNHFLYTQGFNERQDGTRVKYKDIK